MNPVDLVAWAFWGGVSLLILAPGAAVFVFCVRIAREM